MGSVHYIGKSFGPDAIHAVRVAFDSAWQDLQASGNVFSVQFPADRACEKIAKRIIHMVQRGERDPDHLTEDALDYLAQQGEQPFQPAPRNRSVRRRRLRLVDCGRTIKANLG